MAHTLEICHPNDFLANRWKVVGEISDDPEQWADHIASPAFDFYRGLIVRVMYSGKHLKWIGVYNDTECVNFTHGSEILNRLWDFDTLRFDGFLREYDFLNAWHNSIEPDNMLYAVMRFIPKFTLIMATCDGVAKIATELGIDVVHHDVFNCIQCARDYCSTGKKPSYFNRLFDKINKLGNETAGSGADYQTIKAASELMSIFGHNIYTAPLPHASYAIERAIFSYEMDERKYIELDISNMLRKFIPMHEICDGLATYDYDNDPLNRRR